MASTRPVEYPRRTARAAAYLEWFSGLLAGPAPDGQTRDCRRLLIIEPFRIGDAALLTGMLDPLRERYPQSEVHLLLSPVAAPLYESDPRVARVHRFVFPWTDLPPPRAGWLETVRFLRGLRQLEFDVGIDPRGDVRSQIALRLAGCRERVGLARYLASNIELRGRLLTRAVHCDRLAHRVEMHDAILRALGARPSAGPPARPTRSSGALRRVVLSVGAGWAFRRWPEERWGELAVRLAESDGVEVRLIGGEADAGTLARLAEVVPPGVVVRQTNLREFLDELQAADVVVSADSAAIHLASEWFGVPVVALFGPGVVSLYRPRSAGSVVIHHQERFPCAPCLQKRCVRPRDSCMPSISVPQVEQAVVRALNGSVIV